jgi:hypothetical protein
MRLQAVIHALRLQHVRRRIHDALLQLSYFDAHCLSKPSGGMLPPTSHSRESCQRQSVLARLCVEDYAWKGASAIMSQKTPTDLVSVVSDVCPKACRDPRLPSPLVSFGHSVPYTPLPQQHESLQHLGLMAATIAALENIRRDTQDPVRGRQLQRFTERLRRAGYDLKDIL